MLHAPRQTGKSSTLLAFRDLLNGGVAGDLRCIYANVEAAQTAREDVGRAMQAILDELAERADLLATGSFMSTARGPGEVRSRSGAGDSADPLEPRRSTTLGAAD